MTAVPTAPETNPPPPLESPRPDDRGRVTAFIGYGLLIAGLFTGGISSFLAMILAYDRKGQCGPIIRSHLMFQLRVFWSCFAMMVLSGIFLIWGFLRFFISTLHSAPARGAPDAQMVSLTAPWLQNIDVETWSYGFSAHTGTLPPLGSWQMSLGCALFCAAVLLSWIGPGFGLVRLASNRPIGHSGSEPAEPLT